MKFKIDDVFSVNGETGFPEMNYMVQSKVFLGQWNNVRMFVTRKEAEEAVATLERLGHKTWPI